MRRHHRKSRPAPRGFDALPASLLASQVPPGFRVRSRVALPGKTLQETDELVEAAGGRREAESPRPKPSVRRTDAYDWYLLPDSAFDEEQDTAAEAARHGAGLEPSARRRPEGSLG